MRGTHAARYLFAACLCASTVDLLVVDCVVGPLALRAEPPATTTASTAAASASTATATAAATNTAPSAPPVPMPVPSAPPRTSAGSNAPRIVARFDSDQPAASSDELPALAAAMLANPRTRIVLEGHADPSGDPSHNRTLSIDRARWAEAKLVELGVSPARIEVIGHGAERLLTEDDDDAAVASNRRVEFRWLTTAPSPEEGDR